MSSATTADHHGHGHNHDHDHHDHDHHDHDHHDHGHGPGGQSGHHHAPATFGVAFAVGAALNLGFVIGEVTMGLYAHSIALIGDAGHNLGDLLGLLLAWLAAFLSRKGPSGRYTYGYGRGTILAALINAGLLLVSVGGIAAEAIRRLIEPDVVAPLLIAATAGVGILVNGATALLFSAGRRGDINLRGVFQHMLGDAVVSAGVVVAALVLWRTGWQRIDPAVSLVLALVIAWSTRGLLRESLTLSFDAVPARIDAAAVRLYLSSLPDVLRLHDLHIWPMSTSRAALTCHLVIGGVPPPGFLGSICAGLHERFGIDHSTLQLEQDGDPSCVLEPDQVI